MPVRSFAPLFIVTFSRRSPASQWLTNHFAVGNQNKTHSDSEQRGNRLRENGGKKNSGIKSYQCHGTFSSRIKSPFFKHSANSYPAKLFIQAKGIMNTPCAQQFDFKRNKSKKKEKRKACMNMNDANLRLTGLTFGHGPTLFSLEG